MKKRNSHKIAYVFQVLVLSQFVFNLTKVGRFSCVEPVEAHRREHGACTCAEQVRVVSGCWVGYTPDGFQVSGKQLIYK